MVEGMSVVVNAMLSLMSDPTPTLCDLSVHTMVKLYTFGMFALAWFPE